MKNRKLTDLELQKMQLNLHETLNVFLEGQTEGDHEIGWIPEETTALMTEAAMAVLKTVNATNAFIEKEGLFEKQ